MSPQRAVYVGAAIGAVLVVVVFLLWSSYDREISAPTELNPTTGEAVPEPPEPSWTRNCPSLKCPRT